jgi:predicted NBD/HSP70 family sugar kinase
VGTILLAPHNQRRLSFIDSLLVEGTNGLAGELGHLAIGRRLIEDINAASHDDLAPMSYDDWTCVCGAHHHLQAFASGAAVVKRLQASGYAIPRDDRGSASVLREFLEGNPDDLQIHAMRDAGRILGRALAGPILMLDPYSISVTGSLASEHLVDGIRRERDMWAHAIKDTVKVSHREGPLSEFIGVRGAALAVMRGAVYRRFFDRRSALPETFPFRSSDLRKLSSN